jgi:6-phosphogluconolactonase
MSSPRLRVVESPAVLADTAAKWIHDRAWDVVGARGRFTLALSGGNTPRALYARLAAGPLLPWEQMDICFGDERAVPPDSPESNYRMVRETLLKAPGLPPERVHRIRAELPPVEAARDYEQTLRRLFPGAAPVPRFDLILLGLGPDGHTASLFPHSPGLAERQAWVLANWVEKFGTHRLSFSYPVLDAAAEVLFLVAGADKEWALHEVLQGGASVEDVPARGVRPTGGALTFLVDRAAAAGLVLQSA